MAGAAMFYLKWRNNVESHVDYTETAAHALQRRHMHPEFFSPHQHGYYFRFLE